MIRGLTALFVSSWKFSKYFLAYQSINAHPKRRAHARNPTSTESSPSPQYLNLIQYLRQWKRLCILFLQSHFENSQCVTACCWQWTAVGGYTTGTTQENIESPLWSIFFLQAKSHRCILIIALGIYHRSPNPSRFFLITRMYLYWFDIACWMNYSAAIQQDYILYPLQGLCGNVMPFYNIRICDGNSSHIWLGIMPRYWDDGMNDIATWWLGTILCEDQIRQGGFFSLCRRMGLHLGVRSTYCIFALQWRELFVHKSWSKIDVWQAQTPWSVVTLKMSNRHLTNDLYAFSYFSADWRISFTKGLHRMIWTIHVRLATPHVNTWAALLCT